MNRHLLLGALAATALVPAIAAAQPQPAAPAYGANSAYTGQDPWAGAPQGIQARTEWLGRQIRTAMASDALDIDQGRSALKELGDIRKTDAADRAGGALNDEQRAKLQARLDVVHATVVKAISHNSVRSF
jgi:hypothetical protein